MPLPHFCPRPECRYHAVHPPNWFVRYGTYHCAAQGTVQRYRCRCCAHTLSDQSESLHYFAKRRLPLRAIRLSLLGGASLREIARRYRVSPPTVQTAVLRLGRQAMAAHLHLLDALHPRDTLVYDGLRTFLTSQDYPCDITTVVEARGETILTMTHCLSRRGGTMTPAQRQRVERKAQTFSPQPGAMSEAISLLHTELWSYLRPSPCGPAKLLTDEHPLYAALLRRSPVARHLTRCRLLLHLPTPAAAPRTTTNPLFPVNYVDRLLRHRLKEHTRQTIAFGRQATLQMHRAWIFAHDHNCLREYRVKRPALGEHAVQGAVDAHVVERLKRQLFARRIRVVGLEIPETIRQVWMGQLVTPPHRWKVGQTGSSVHIPAYAVRDLT